jgi:hypothetical protein
MCRLSCLSATRHDYWATTTVDSLLRYCWGKKNVSIGPDYRYNQSRFLLFGNGRNTDLYRNKQYFGLTDYILMRDHRSKFFRGQKTVVPTYPSSSRTEYNKDGRTYLLTNRWLDLAESPLKVFCFHYMRGEGRKRIQIFLYGDLDGCSYKGLHISTTATQ